MKLIGIDYFIIILYFLFILFLGFWVSRKEKNSSIEDYILAGRKLTLPLFVASLVATWYGSILGVGEFVYNSGIIAWVCFGLPYYVAAFLFAIFIAKKVRESNVKTIPEQISQKFGVRAGRLASLIILIITIPSAYTLMLGTIIQLITGWDIGISIVIGAILSLVYIYTGGLKADIITNTAQFILMYIGFGVLLFFVWNYFGDFNQMLSKLPATHKSVPGSSSWQYILSWYVIAFQTFIDPSFHQRCAAAQNSKIARNGVLVSIFFWMIFDFLTLSTGLYARAYFQIDNPLMTFPIIADKVLPYFWKGIFIVSMLATVMSTLDSYAFISATTIGHDLLDPIKSRLKWLKNLSSQQLTQFGLVITSVISVVIAIILPSAISILYNSASIAVPGLIYPLMISMNSRYYLKERSVLWLMIISSLVASGFMLLKFLNIAPFNSIEPMMPGILVSIFLGLLFTRRKSKTLR